MEERGSSGGAPSVLTSPAWMPSPKGARYAEWSVLGQKRRTYRVVCTGPPAAAAAAAAAASAAAVGLAAAATALLSASSAVPAAPAHAPMPADILEPGSKLLALARGGAGALPRRTEAREPRTSGWPTWSNLGGGWREAKVRARARARVNVQGWLVNVQGWLRAERAGGEGPPPPRWSQRLRTRASPPSPRRRSSRGARCTRSDAAS